MRPISWIIATFAGIASIVLLAVGVNAHFQPLGIQNVTAADYAAIINATAAKQNQRLSVEQSALVDMQYVNDSIAVVRFTTAEGTRVSFLFEYYNGTVYLTNYSTSGFASTDLNNPDIATFISNANE